MTKMEKATLSDIANLAGVSKAAAGKVLNGSRSHIRVGRQTRERILEAARRLNYQPNVAASILAGGKSRLIGVLIDSRAPGSMYDVLAEVEHAADLLGYRILVAQAHDNPEKHLQAYYSLKQIGVDGIISFSHDYPELDSDFRLVRRLKDDPKIVFVRNILDPDVSAVDVDFHPGMKRAMDHLAANGYRKTALLLIRPASKKLSVSCHRRIEAFLGCRPEGEVLYLEKPEEDVSSLEKECARLIREKLLPGEFDSIIAVNDNLAILMMRALLAQGIRIPQDFGLVGFNNLPIDESLPITLSSLYYDRKELAESAFRILLDKIAGKTEPVRTLCEMKFAPRESSSKKKDER